MTRKLAVAVVSLGLFLALYSGCQLFSHTEVPGGPDAGDDADSSGGHKVGAITNHVAIVPTGTGYMHVTGGVQDGVGSGGGAGAAAGSTTQIQYNLSGSLAGDANMTFDGTSINLISSVGSTNYGTLASGAGIGRVRTQNNETIAAARNAGNTGDLVAMSLDTQNLFLGCDNAFGHEFYGAYLVGSNNASLQVGSTVYFRAAAADVETTSNANFGIGTSQYGGGSNVMAFGPAAAVPTATSLSSGDVLYAGTDTAQHLRAMDQAGIKLDLQHGQVSVAVTAAVTLTTDQFASQIIKLTGTVGTQTIKAPNGSIDAFGTYRIIRNATNGTQVIAATNGTGTVSMLTNKAAIIGWDSGGAYRITADQ